MNRRIQILDCTLRDGGLGLEDAKKNGISSVQFSEEDVKEIADKLTESNIDIIELGAIELSEDDKRPFAIYQDIESVSKMMPTKKKDNQMYAALYRGPDTPIEDIPEWNEAMCQVVRVIIRYSELQKSLDFCAALSQKGYKVFVQPMLTMRYSEEEIQLLINESNRMGAYALYFVDSYGYMQSADIKRFFEVFDRGLDEQIRIGFHAHNNMNLAFSNVLEMLSIPSKRKIIIDSCLLGMGQGAGNLQTELFIGYLNKEEWSPYNYGAVLDACEIVERYTTKGAWGYSVARLLPAIYNTAYKYAISLREHYNLKYSEMDYIFKNIPEELRQRYTEENTKQLLKVAGFASKVREEE